MKNDSTQSTARSAGRPRKDSPRRKSVRFQISCQPEEYERFKALAAASGKTLSQFIRDKILF